MWSIKHTDLYGSVLNKGNAGSVMVIEWNSDLEIGIPAIDEQHKCIVNYINALKTAHHSNNDKLLNDVMRDLVDYTVSHFVFEEKLMFDAGYPLTLEHAKVHGMFTHRIQSFKDRLDSGEDIALELMMMLKSWLIDHIQRDDKEYADVVLANLNTPE